ncbi:MAG TPA: ribbon-helix-helix protein, CopG family [Ktedonobacteraceae bacterium]|nr:ribbon-helix-helix protein, CopG family [Ktedonobacteraceae bacterium]
MAFARQEQKRREMTLRIPAELKERLERIAQANRRSLTREIEVALQKYADENEPIDSCASNVVS